MAARATISQAGSVVSSVNNNAITARLKRQLYKDVWPWTFTRNSIAYRNDGKQVAVNEPRFERSLSDGTPQGLKVEVAATNLLSLNDSTGKTLFVSNDSALSQNTLDTTFGRSDNFSVKSTQLQAASNFGFYTPSYSCNPNTAYSASGYVYTADLVPNTAFYITWRDSGGASLGNTGVAAQYPILQGQWTRLVATGTSPANAASVRIICTGGVCPVGHVRWFDDFQFEALGYATSWQVGGTPRAAETLSFPTAGMDQNNFDIQVSVSGAFFTGEAQVIIGASPFFYLAFSATLNQLTLVWQEDGATKSALASGLAVLYGNRTFRVTYDGATATVFVDGVPRIQAAAVLNAAFPAAMALGTISSTSNNYLANCNFRDLLVSRSIRQPGQVQLSGIKADDNTLFFAPWSIT